mmetsp:Transcript_60228/g.160241  ORF Transcript_60228/g.160241 Transcript_60228/m.160241 type:complete len:210 (-) Transcript_60228:280-909(-)
MDDNSHVPGPAILVVPHPIAATHDRQPEPGVGGVDPRSISEELEWSRLDRSRAQAKVELAVDSDSVISPCPCQRPQNLGPTAPIRVLDYGSYTPSPAVLVIPHPVRTTHDVGSGLRVGGIDRRPLVIRFWWKTGNLGGLSISKLLKTLAAAITRRPLGFRFARLAGHCGQSHLQFTHAAHPCSILRCGPNRRPQHPHQSTAVPSFNNHA